MRHPDLIEVLDARVQIKPVVAQRKRLGRGASPGAVQIRCAIGAR